MKNTINVKEKIIQVTTDLIECHDGDVKKITARMIAEKAGIGLGLINYHFKSKENLVTACVQRIIGKVVLEFNESTEYSTDKERLIAVASYVFDFLFEHPAISKISILGDFQNYCDDCNSALSQRGFMRSIITDIADKDKPFIAFILTAAMQVAFLGSGAVKALLGYDFTIPKDRLTYIEKLVSVLFENNTKEAEL